MTGAAVELLLGRLDGVKQVAGSWKALCPAHPDRNPSLSISQGAERALVHCHAGCTLEAVLAALDLKRSDLFDASRTRTEDRPRVVARYAYTDEQGEVLYEVERMRPKGFRQRRPDGDGGWIYKLGDTRRVLYHLPKVIEAVRAGQVVYVVEGEKDADALVAAGLCATCSPAGAGKFDKVPDAAQVLAGAHVVVVADKDAPGGAHARQVRSILQSVVESLDIVEAATGKDAADHLAAGMGVDDFVPVDLDDADELVEDDQLPMPVDWHALFQQDHDVEWLVEDLWPWPRHLQVFAARKTGKSLIALWMAIKTSQGVDPFTGDPIAPRRVAYLDYEMTEDDLQERAEEMGFEPDDLANVVYYLLPLMPKLDTPEGGERLLRLVQRDRAEVVVIDTLSRVVGGEENSNDTFRAFYACTGLLLKHHQIAMIRLDHEGHEAGRARGASAKADDVDVNWQLKRTDTGYQFVNKGSRVSTVAHEVAVRMQHEPSLGFSRTERVWPEGTAEKARVLDQLGAPLGLSRRKARRFLEDAGVRAGRNEVIGAALEYRRKRLRRTAEGPGTNSGTTHFDPSGTGSGATCIDHDLAGGTSAGTTRNQYKSDSGTVPPLLEGDGSTPCPKESATPPSRIIRRKPNEVES